MSAEEKKSIHTRARPGLAGQGPGGTGAAYRGRFLRDGWMVSNLGGGY